jgi:hypothetical protein
MVALTRSIPVLAFGNISLLGMALTSSLQIAQLVSFTLISISQLSKNMNSLDRIYEFINLKQEERPWTTEQQQPQVELRI